MNGARNDGRTGWFSSGLKYARCLGPSWLPESGLVQPTGLKVRSKPHPFAKYL